MAEEISDLMGLLWYFIKLDFDEFVCEGVWLWVIGDYMVFVLDFVDLIDGVLVWIVVNIGLMLVIGFNYGLYDEIVCVVCKLVGYDLVYIDVVVVEVVFDIGDLFLVDLLICILGEYCLFNFMLW